MSELEVPLWTVAKHDRILAKEHRVLAIAKTCVWGFQRAASLLAQHLEGREFTIGNLFYCGRYFIE